jgi:peptidoglycan/LPS O-acetylase OafA/YrhL
VWYSLPVAIEATAAFGSEVATPGALVTAPPPKPADIKFLDGFRGLAALFVLIHHASYLLHRGYFVQIQSFGKVTSSSSHPGLYRALSLAFYPFQYGHFAVVFFFVLSGFVIHLRYARELHRSPASARFDWAYFVWRRFRRIYPPLVLAIVLTSALYALGIYLSPTIYRSQTLYSWVNSTTFAERRWTTLLGNLTFMMPFYSTYWSGDGPLWSLGYEWWFYMIYPVFWWISKKNQWAATALIVVFFMLSFFPGKWPSTLACQTLGLMLTWWLGALLADIYVGRIRLHFAWLVPLIIFMAAFKARALPDQGKSAIIGLGFVGLLAACFWWNARGGRLRLLVWLKPLGDMSYTLYVTHMPILIFVAAICIFRSPRATLPDWPFVLVLGIIVALLFAWIAHFLVEVPFTRQNKGKP